MKFDLNPKVLKLIIRFEVFSFLLSLKGCLILFIHLKFYIDKSLYYIGIKLFQAGLIAGIFSFCCGVFFNRVKSIQR